MNKPLFIVIALSFLLVGCGSDAKHQDHLDAMDRSPVIKVFAGQNMRAIEAYYGADSLPTPDGFTEYISYDVGSEYKAFAPDAPKLYLGNDGLMAPTNWGSGVQCVQCWLADMRFQGAEINLGLYMAGPQAEDGSMCHGSADCNVAKMAAGLYDTQLTELANWALEHQAHHIYLRIGYEFDGIWNNYDPVDYVAAFKHIVHLFDQLGVTNVDFVWQTSGYATTEQIDSFYPNPDALRDHYVDQVGYSYFNIDHTKPGVNELAFARAQQLPVFLNEVAMHTGDCSNQIDIATDPSLAIEWIDNFEKHLRANQDQIMAIAYINNRWNDQIYAPQWQDQTDHHCGGFFSNSNSMLHDNESVEAKWKELVTSDLFCAGECR